MKTIIYSCDRCGNEEDDDRTHIYPIKMIPRVDFWVNHKDAPDNAPDLCGECIESLRAWWKEADVAEELVLSEERITRVRAKLDPRFRKQLLVDQLNNKTTDETSDPRTPHECAHDDATAVKMGPHTLEEAAQRNLGRCYLELEEERNKLLNKDQVREKPSGRIMCDGYVV